jgi:hypothetical protein
VIERVTHRVWTDVYQDLRVLEVVDSRHKRLRAGANARRTRREEPRVPDTRGFATGLENNCPDSRRRDLPWAAWWPTQSGHRPSHSRPGRFTPIEIPVSDCSGRHRLRAWPGNALKASGEAGIRTLGTLARTLVFETSTIGHSVTSPRRMVVGRIILRRCHRFQTAAPLFVGRRLYQFPQNPDAPEPLRIASSDSFRFR